jgi:hypothetical protein
MTPPPAAVLDAFGLPEHGHPLPGGEGRSFRHGRAVLKSVEDAAERPGPRGCWPGSSRAV